MRAWHSVRPRQTIGYNQEKIEQCLPFTALKIMEMAKEEKCYYSQSLGTYNPKLGQGGVLQIPTLKVMLIPVSVRKN